MHLIELVCVCVKKHDVREDDGMGSRINKFNNTTLTHGQVRLRCICKCGQNTKIKGKVWSIHQRSLRLMGNWTEFTDYPASPAIAPKKAYRSIQLADSSRRQCRCDWWWWWWWWFTLMVRKWWQEWPLAGWLGSFGKSDINPISDTGSPINFQNPLPVPGQWQSHYAARHRDT